MKKNLFLLLFFSQVLHYQCFADDFVVVHSIKIAGNVRTKDKIIFREMLLKSGDTLQKDNLNVVLESERQKITNTNLFITLKIIND